MVVGRQAELERLRQHVRGAAVGVGGCVFVTGEGGIGKSRLLNEVILEAKRRGVPVLVGRASVGGPVSFGVMAEALRSWLRSRLAGATRPPAVFDAGLRLILPEWPGEPTASGLTASQLRLLALEGLVELVGGLAAGHGVVVALDDVHAADAESLDALRYLAGAGLDGVLIVAAARMGESAVADQLVDNLAHLGLAEVAPVEPLEAGEVDDLLSAILGSRPPVDFVREVISRTDGVPLLVEEVLDAHVRAGSLIIDERGVRWRGGVNIVPRAVAAVVGGRLDRLPPEQRDVITAGAVVGLADGDLLAAVARQPPTTVRAALIAAVDTGILETIAGRIEFRHAVVGDAVRDYASPGAVRAAHARAVAALEPVAEGDPSVLERRATHLVALGESDAAAAALVAAAGASLAARAPLHAEALASRAHALASRPDGRDAAADVLAAALSAQGRWSDALAVDQNTVTRRGQSTDRWMRMARCALDSRLIHLARSLTNEAAGFGEPSPFFAVTVGRLELFDGDAGSALTRADRVLASSAGLDPSVLCGALDLRGRALDFLGRRAEAAAAWSRQADVAETAGLTSERLRGLVSLAELELFEGQPPRRMFDAVDLARDSGALVEWVWAELNLSIALSIQGDPAAGARVAAAAAERCRQHRLDLLPFVMMAQLGAVSLLGDPRFDELLSETQRLGRDAADAVIHTSGIASDHCLHLGRYDDAMVHINRVLDVVRSTPGGIPADSPNWLPLALLGAGRDEAAGKALAVIRGLPDTSRWYGRSVVLAVTDAVIACDEAAVDAALASATGRMPFDLALLRVFAAEIMGGAARARWLREALDLYEAHGGELAIDRVRGLLRQAGGPVPRRRRMGAVPPELIPLGITAREADILALVEEGLSNATIAEKLYVSVRTVESHVSSLLAKLGVTSRSQLTGAKMRRD